MLKFTLLLENADISKLIIAIVIAVVIVAVGSFLFFFFMRNNHIKKQVHDLSKKYDSLHDMLTVQIESDLKRVLNISQINVEYEAVYNINNSNFNEIMSIEDAIALEAINGLNKLLIEKKYNQIKEDIEDVKIKVNELEEKCSKLSKSINEIINVDDDNRQEILKYRREFREVKDSYESHKNELKFLEDSFIAIFDKIESYFSEAEELLAGAHYEESKEKFPEIDHVIKALSKSISILPKLTMNAFVIMPNNINDLIDNYNVLTNQGYPLHHLKFQSAIDSYNAALEKIQNKLKLFQSKNVEYELNQIRDAILTLSNDFEQEVNARNYYSEEFDKIYNGSYRIENKFIKMRRSLPEYKVTYKLNESYVDDLDKIQKEIDELGSIKRTLDTYVHSSSQQPYSTLANKLKNLSNAMGQIEKDIEDVHLYLVSLRTDTNNGYSYMTKTFVELKQLESLLRKIGVPSITFTLTNDFKQCYEILNECGEVIHNLPIDVSLLNDYIKQLEKCLANVKEKLEDLPRLQKKAEDSIVYANQYRSAFDDVKTTLLRAEKSFFEGDFDRTSNETVAMLKKIKPETGKQSR